MKLKDLNDLYLDGDFKIEIKDESNYCLDSKKELYFGFEKNGLLEKLFDIFNHIEKFEKVLNIEKLGYNEKIKIQTYNFTLINKESCDFNEIIKKIRNDLNNKNFVLGVNLNEKFIIIEIEE